MGLFFPPTQNPWLFTGREHGGLLNMTMNADAVPECYPLGIIQEAVASRIPREFSGWREWPGARVLAQAVIEALKVRETVLAAHAQSPVAGVQAEAVRVTEADVIQTCEVHGFPLDPGQMEVVTAVVNQILLSASKPAATPDIAQLALDFVETARKALKTEPSAADGYYNGYHDALAASPAAPARSGKPIYQVQKIDGTWEDVQPFEKAGKYGRIVYADPQTAQTAESDGAVPTLWEAFEMGFSLRGAMLGHVLDGRDVGRLTTCEFWHPSMLGMHEGTDLHVGLSVSEAIVKVKTEVRRRLNAFDEARVAASSAVVLDDGRAAFVAGVLCVSDMTADEARDLARQYSSCVDAARATSPQATATGLTRDAIQQKAVDHGFRYWRAPDAHGVTGTEAQAVELLQDLLGVEVEIAAQTERALTGWEDGVGLLWDVYDRNGKWFKRVISPIGWDAHAVYLYMQEARYAPHIEVRLVSSTTNASPHAPSAAKGERALTCCRMGCDKPSVCERLGECRINAEAQPAPRGEHD